MTDAKEREITPDRMAQILALAGSPNNSSTANIKIDAGGLALWGAVTCCFVMLAVTMVGSIFIAIALSDLNRQTQELRERDDILQAYINAGYIQPEKESP